MQNTIEVRTSDRFRVVAQENPLGCAVACVASRCGLSYRQALTLFARGENAWTRGYYCPEVVAALAQAGLPYAFEAFNPTLHSRLLDKEGTIVFIGACRQYPAGHYLIRARGGWMNPWANFPRMVPVEAELQRELPGTAAYLLYEGG